MKKIATTAVVLVTWLALPQLGVASEELAQKNNCLACHKVDQKHIGPAYKDIAAKYDNEAATVDMLVEKVMKGGTGTWGQIPMPPNPMLGQEDAKTLVEWVLSQ